MEETCNKHLQLFQAIERVILRCHLNSLSESNALRPVQQSMEDLGNDINLYKVFIEMASKVMKERLMECISTFSKEIKTLISLNLDLYNRIKTKKVQKHTF